MTERKPPGMSFETWVDRQITQAQEQRGVRRAAPAPASRCADLDRDADQLRLGPEVGAPGERPTSPACCRPGWRCAGSAT